MTENNPTEDPESMADSKGSAEIIPSEVSPDQAKKGDHVELSEQQRDGEFDLKNSNQNEMFAQTERKSSSSEDILLDSGTASDIQHDGDVNEQHEEKQETGAQSQSNQTNVSMENDGTEHVNEIDTSNSRQDLPRLSADPVASRSPLLATRSEKQAVQDPSVTEIVADANENAVIELDTFENDGSDGENEGIPTAEGANADVEDEKEPADDEVPSLALHGSQGETIDLTASPTKQPTEIPSLMENNENYDIEGRDDAMGTQTGQEVISIGEAEDQLGGTIEIDMAKQSFAAEFLKSSPGDEDERLEKATTDNETVSADLQADSNEEEASSAAVLLEKNNGIEEEPEIEGHLPSEDPNVTETILEEGMLDKRNKAETEDGGPDGPAESMTPKADDVDINMEAGASNGEAEGGDAIMTHDDYGDDEADDDSGSGQEREDLEEDEAEEDSPETASDLVTDPAANQAQEGIASADHKEHLEGIPVNQTSLKEQALQLAGREKSETVVSSTEPTTDNHLQSSKNGLSGKAEKDDGKREVLGLVNASVHEENKQISSDNVLGNKAETVTGQNEAKDISGARRESGVLTGVASGSIPDKSAVAEEEGAPATFADSETQRKRSEGDQKTDVDIATVEDEASSKIAHGSSLPKRASPNDQSAQTAKSDADTTMEAAPSANREDTSVVTTAVQQPPATGTDTSVEPDKSPKTGHQAPMFGIQLSRPMKSGPVSFSSPPSFPRYSFNPNAQPFLPAKRQNDAEALTAHPLTSSVVTSTPSKGIASSPKEERGSAVVTNDQLQVTDAASEKMEVSPSQPMQNSTSVVSKSPTFAVKAIPAVAKTETDRPIIAENLTQPEPPLSEAAKEKSPSKKPVQKKVSFAPIPLEVARASQKEKPPREPHLQPVSRISEQNQAKSEATTFEVDGTVEKQRLVQSQTAEGLRREVNNVMVAMRQGSGKVRPERKKFTVRLITGAQGKAVLLFFKVTDSSLKMYASLDSSKDNLRVRKVTNRQYVMSVAKMAPPGDETAEVVVKYFLHFDEKETFEEMYSQCVLHLQKQTKSVTGLKKPEERPTVGHTGVKHPKQESKLRSAKSGGVKLPADGSNVAQVSKKSKLLADKKKLLDKMAALRRKKGQPGTPVSKERQSQSPIEIDKEGVSGVLAATDSEKRSTPVKAEAVQATLSKAEREPATTAKRVSAAEANVQPSKKRTAEIRSNENATKKARLPKSHPQSPSIRNLKKPQPRLQSEVPNVSPTKQSEESVSTDAKTSHLTRQPEASSSVEAAKDLSHGGNAAGGVSEEQQKLSNAEVINLKSQLQQMEEEKKALQVKLESQNSMLHAEQQKAQGASQKNLEAWQRIVQAVEALSVDAEFLRRDEKDRSLEALTRCEASSSEDFFARLHTFRPSTWAAFENIEIGALECALRGWFNCGPDKIRSSDGAEITLSESFDESSLRQGEIERVRTLLREGHCLLSGWIGQSCPELFRSLQGSQRTLTKEQLKARVDGLEKIGQKWSGVRFEWGTSALLLSEDIYAKLAAFNWCLEDETLWCSWCNRRVALSSVHRFDAKSKHYGFCPFRTEDWKASVLHNATTLGIEGNADVVMTD